MSKKSSIAGAAFGLALGLAVPAPAAQAAPVGVTDQSAATLPALVSTAHYRGYRHRHYCCHRPRYRYAYPGYYYYYSPPYYAYPRYYGWPGVGFGWWW